MKKILTMLCGSLMVLLLFVGSGNVALAHGDENCDCPPTLEGAEKNKVIAGLLSSEEFKSKKKELIQSSYSWQGANEILVVRALNNYGELTTVIAVPFYNLDGKKMAMFVNGQFVELADPPPTE